MPRGKRPDLSVFLSKLKRHYRAVGRSHLPWRKTRDPYLILVSEIMLQQTQVERVVPFYVRFCGSFPDTRALARAPLSKVLALWQGLGYNRRAKLLRDAARAIEDTHGGKFPRDVEDIDALPGVGPYTARAVAAFAWNSPEVFIETNIRTACIHFDLLKSTGTVSDSELLPVVGKALAESKMPPRDFYAALMDYGSFLKRQGVRLNARSTHYAKQSKFQGSARQLRGALLRELLEKPKGIPALARCTGRKREEVERELACLEKEGIILKRKDRFDISK